jgi:hypothetical protein
MALDEIASMGRLFWMPLWMAMIQLSNMAFTTPPSQERSDAACSPAQEEPWYPAQQTEAQSLLGCIEGLPLGEVPALLIMRL